MEQCYGIWSRAPQSSLSGLYRYLERLPRFSTLKTITNIRNDAILSLLYSYFHGNCFGELHFSFKPVLTFQGKFRHATNIVGNSNSFFQRTAIISCLDKVPQRRKDFGIDYFPLFRQFVLLIKTLYII